MNAHLTHIPSGPTEMPRPGAFRFWIMRARPGERMVYHVGRLAEDRVNIYPDAKGRIIYAPIEPVETLANIAAEAERDGRVTLVQRRLGPNYFAYEAVKRRVRDTEQVAA